MYTRREGSARQRPDCTAMASIRANRLTRGTGPKAAELRPFGLAQYRFLHPRTPDPSAHPLHPSRRHVPETDGACRLAFILTNASWRSREAETPEITSCRVTLQILALSTSTSLGRTTGCNRNSP